MGARMPWTSLCFSLGAMGMIGLPPMAGFVSKVHLGIGAVQSDAAWVIAVLAGSTLLNAAYFLPLLYRMWFLSPAADAVRGDGAAALVVPAVATAAAALGVGVFAGAGLSPLSWSELIIEREYLP